MTKWIELHTCADGAKCYINMETAKAITRGNTLNGYPCGIVVFIDDISMNFRETRDQIMDLMRRTGSHQLAESGKRAAAR